jgi:antitoxin PrlF
VLDVCKDIPYRKDDSYGGLGVITSKLTSKAQTTIPQPVRAALQLKEGDELIYQIEDERVILTKARRGKEGDDPFRTFNEWNSAADRKAYGSL